MARVIEQIITLIALCIAIIVAYWAGYSIAEQRAQDRQAQVIERLQHCLARLPYPWQYGYMRCVREARSGE